MTHQDPIAIVGIGGIFPQSQTLAQYWDHIRTGRDLSSPLPQERLNLSLDNAFSADIAQPDKVYSRKGYFVDHENLNLDYNLLKIDPQLVQRLDPMFSLGLYAAQEAWRDAAMTRIDPTQVGVIMGNIVLPTESASALARQYLGRTFREKLLKERAPESFSVDPINTAAAGLPAGVIAQALGLGRGSYTLDAACASSLFALKLAADELHSGRARAMITGGLSRPDCLYTQMGFSQLRALSPRGVASPFDAKADGLVVGEGCGLMVLKRLSDALQDGDRIYGTIAGIGLSNDTDGSLLAPSSEGQLRAMTAAYEDANWKPWELDMVECHATGTPLGDKVEFNSLRQLWREAPEGLSPVIGSVKANVGHLLTAAGSAALIKALLAMKEQTLPPTANFQQAPAEMDLEASPFQVLSQPASWPQTPGRPRRFAVSAFGFGGTNAHVLIEEFNEQRQKPVAIIPGPNPQVAIVGIDAHFGPWQGLSAFRDRVFSQNEETPPELKGWWGVEGSQWFQGQTLPKGWQVPQIEMPFGRFRIPPNELLEMLPQQLLMLLTADRALQKAKLSQDDLLKTGVFIGLGLDMNTTHYQLRWDLEEKARIWNRQLNLNMDEAGLAKWTADLRNSLGPALNANRVIGGLGSITASRIAREYHIGGPSFTISSEETSGIRALEAAVRLLQKGELETALVGAVDLACEARQALAEMLRDPLPKTPGDGAVAMVLKRLDDAERDGDEIFGVIKGIAATSGAVNMPQESARSLDLAQQEAGGGELGYLETHAIVAQNKEDHLPCSNLMDHVGNTGAASGLAAVARAALALKYEVLPPMDSQNNRSQYWLRNSSMGPRRAAVCSGGLDGNYTSVILEAAGQPATLPVQNHGLYFVEGHTVEELTAGLIQMKHELETHSQQFPSTVSFNPEKALAVSFIADSPEECLSRIKVITEAFQSTPQDPFQSKEFRTLARARKIFFNPKPLGDKAKIAFVFPGSGSHFADMGRALAMRWPHIYRNMDQKTGYLKDQLKPQYFWSGADISELDNKHAWLLSAQVALGVAVSDLVRGFGIEPTGSIGYSLGESAANFAFNAWQDRDGMHLRTQETSLFTQDLAGPCKAVRKAWGLTDKETVDWILGVATCSAEEVKALLPEIPRAYLLIVNTHQECVIGGDRTAVEELVKRLKARLFPLKGVVTVHCEVLEPVAEAYRNHHLFDVTPPQGVTFYSCGWGKAYELTRESAADAIHAQARFGVDFPKTIEAAYADGFNLFLEMGPGASCTRMIQKILKNQPHVALSVCQPGDLPINNLLKMLARLIVERVPVDLSLLTTEPQQEEKVASRVLNIIVGGDPFQIPQPPEAKPLPEKPVVQAVPKTAPPKPRPATPVFTKPAGPPTTALPSSSGVDYMPVSTMEANNSTAVLESVAAQTAAALSARSKAHEAFLRFSQNGSKALAESMSTQMNLLQAMGGTSEAVAQSRAPSPVQPIPAYSETPAVTQTSAQPPVLDRDKCLEFAIGKISNVLGPEFAEIDRYPTRVRLPDEPLMLVDRIMEMSGKEMESGRCVTEHDVLHNGWYLDCGRIPTCIAIEAGQADLFLSAYLGADFRTKGLSTYRLLDAAVTFHGDLPKPGEIISYDIEIKRFFRQANTWFFYFQFVGSVNGKPLLTMLNGCAGFFSPQELEAGKGVVRSKDSNPESAAQKPEEVWTWTPLEKASYTKAQLNALRQGNLEGCFGSLFGGLPIQKPLGLPDGRMNLVDRVRELDPRGGDYGLGLIIAEADIHPDDWFLTCHFIDDKVMPGTLMYECCLHTMRVFLYRMGWVGEASEIVTQPVIGVASQLKCRGQVLETTKMVTYEVHIKEVGYHPEPYAIADAIMYSDQKAIVDISNMCIRFSGLTSEKLESIWHNQTTHAPRQEIQEPCFSYEQLLAFAVGNPSEAFGHRYQPFDRDRKIARFPGPPFLLMSQINSTDVKPWTLTEGGVSEAQYNIPSDAWYFQEDRQETMPYSVLLEVALQSCGWLAAYMGCALQSPKDLLFRNLGGAATQFLPITRHSQWLKTAVKVTSISKTGDIILLFFDYSVSSPDGLVFKGDTYFGFFTPQAMENQVGVTEGQPYQPEADELANAISFSFPHEAPFPSPMMRMVDNITTLIPNGGPHGMGFVEGTIDVDPQAWFFKAHFKGDPVWPGSLGLESFIQILKAFAQNHWGATPQTAFQATALNTKHGWSYRGQIVPGNKKVTVQAIIKAVDEEQMQITADGFLSVDGLVIYQMTDFVLEINH